MLDFPKSLPTDAVLLFLDKVRGKPVDLPILAKAAWNIVGYGLSLSLPEVLPVGATAGEELTEEEALVYVLDHAQNDGVLKQAGPLAMFALSIALKLAVKFLKDELPKLLPID